MQDLSAHHDSLAISSRPLKASDEDLKLLRQDLRAQKQKVIAQNLPMTESEAVKFWAVYNRYTEDLRLGVRIWEFCVRFNALCST